MPLYLILFLYQDEIKDIWLNMRYVKYERFPKGAARKKYQGLSPYFTVYPNSSPYKDIIIFLTTRAYQEKIRCQIRERRVPNKGAQGAVYLVSAKRGYVDSNLKIIVLRNEFEYNYLFELSRQDISKIVLRQLSKYFCFYSQIKTKMATRGLTWKNV